jgi:hypothetical protein
MTTDSHYMCDENYYLQLILFKKSLKTYKNKVKPYKIPRYFIIFYKHITSKCLLRMEKYIGFVLEKPMKLINKKF